MSQSDIQKPQIKEAKVMISFTRGDTFPFKFKTKLNNGTVVTKEDIDTLFITVRKYATKTSPIIFQKKLEDIEIDEEGYCHTLFKPEDTEELMYSNYFFDIEVTLKNGYRKTKLQQFSITKETTIHEGGVINGD